MNYLTTFLALAHRLQITASSRVYGYCRSLSERDKGASTTSLIKITEGVSAADPMYWLPVSGLSQKLHFFGQPQLKTKI